jgi:type II secretory pathway pseudopilin PulG
MRRPLPPPRPALTLVELVLVMTIIGLVTLIGIRQVRLYLDRLAARNAVADAAALVARARDEAVAQRTVVSLHIDTASATLVLRAHGAPLARHRLGQTHGVALSASRDSIAFDVRGIGYGAANLTLVARRGAAVNTLVVSRLGRTRH